MRRGSELRISAPTPASGGDAQPFAGHRKILKQHVLGLLENLRTRWNQDRDVPPILSMTLSPFPVPAPVCLDDPLVPEVQKRVDALGALEVHISPLAPVAAAGSAARDKLLTPKSNAAVAAVAGVYRDPGSIDKHHET
jgi:hypothetical protein